MIDAPGGLEIGAWPCVVDVDEHFYFKPDAGRILMSPAEETDVPPHDVSADDEALALGLHRLMEVTTLEVRRAPRSWAGLRTFTADRVPVFGYEPEAASPFFWFVGQGGYGIQTAPAAAGLAASLILAEAPPAFADPGLVEALSPHRLRFRGAP